MIADASQLKLLIVDGHVRSGTHALLAALAMRSDVVPARLGEAPFIAAFVDFLKDYEEEHPLKDYHLSSWKLTAESRSALFRRMLYALEARLDSPRVKYPLLRWLLYKYPLLRWLLYATTARRTAAETKYSKYRYLVAKTWPSVENIDHFLALFPGMRMFYIIRNGIDVVGSTLRFPSMKHLSFERACMDWANGIQADKQMFSTSYCALIRHELLVDDPVAVFDQSFQQLSIGPDPAPAAYIAYNLANSSFDRPTSQISVRDVFARRVSPWSTWTIEQKSIFRRVCGSTMEEFGYQVP